MKRVFDKIVKEKIRLDTCVPGDIITISGSDIKGRYWSLHSVALKKIKPLTKGKVQIKYCGKRKGDTVQKLDLDAGITVERTRKVTSADHSDATQVVNESFTVNGAQYVDPIHQENSEQHLTRFDEHVLITGSGGNDLNHVLEAMIMAGLSMGGLSPFSQVKSRPRINNDLPQLKNITPKFLENK